MNIEVKKSFDEKLQEIKGLNLTLEQKIQKIKDLCKERSNEEILDASFLAGAQIILDLYLDVALWDQKKSEEYETKVAFLNNVILPLMGRGD